MSALELDRLNFYRACELHGGLVLGQLVRRVREPDLSLALSRHAAAEFSHAAHWTETILSLGGRPGPVDATYQARLGRIVGAPTSVFQVIALSQTFERRVFRHFVRHAAAPGTHPAVRAALERMIAEEKGHLAWMGDWLQLETARRSADVRPLFSRFSLADARVYGEVLTEYRFDFAA